MGSTTSQTGVIESWVDLCG